MQPNNLLFSTRLSVEADPWSQTNKKTNNDLFSKSHKIISSVTDIIYKILLKDVYETIKSKDSLYIEFEYTKNTIILSVFFNPPDTFDNTEQETTISFEMLFAAAEIFIIESYYNFTFCHIPHMTEPHIWNSSPAHPIIKVKHKSSLELLKKLEPWINQMYDIDEHLEISIHINNQIIPLLPIKKSGVSKSSKLSRIPKIVDGIVIPGPPKNGQDTFQFKEEGSNKPMFLKNLNDTRNNFLASKASSKEKVRLSVLNIYKVNRGMQERTNTLYLHEIIRNYEKGQRPLFGE